MMDITYDQLKPLIISEEVDGMMIKLKLKAENQETPMETVAVLMPDQDEIMKNAMKQAGKSAAINMGTNAASNAIGGMIGGIGSSIASAAGKELGSQAASSSMDPEKLMKTNITEQKKQDAILQAFSHLQSYYELRDGKWFFRQPSILTRSYSR